MYINNNFEDSAKTNIQKYKNKIIEYLLDNKHFFINVIEKFDNNFSKIPDSVGFYPFIKNDSVNSLIAFTENGYYYPLLKENYIQDAVSFLSSRLNNIFSIYGHYNITKTLIELMNKPFRYSNSYYSMKLEVNDYKPTLTSIDNYHCIKCDITHFEKIKDLQYLYHKEEVYDKDSYYPYESEMNALKETLSTRLNYAVFSKSNNDMALSKGNVNGEGPNIFQLGGIFTKKEFRKRGLSKLCLTYLINEIFKMNKNNKIILYVKKENEAAVNLYLKLGFKVEYESLLYYY